MSRDAETTLDGSPQTEIPYLFGYSCFGSSSQLLRHGGQIRTFEDRRSPGWKPAFVDAVQNPKWDANFLASLHGSIVEVQKNKKLTLLPILRSCYQGLGIALGSRVDQDFFSVFKVALRHSIIEHVGQMELWQGT